MALQSSQQGLIIFKPDPIRPKLRDSYSTNQIARLVNYYCYGVNVIEFSIRLKKIGSGFPVEQGIRGTHRHKSMCTLELSKMSQNEHQSFAFHSHPLLKLLC